MDTTKKQQKELEITHDGELEIGNLNMPCYVLKNGRRVLSGRSIQSLLRLTPENVPYRTSGSRLKRLFNYKAFKPTLHNNLDQSQFEVIKCKKGQTTIHGYDAASLVDLCDAIIDVRNSGAKLTERQQVIAKQAEILIRSVAKVGIIALIDEATGYQDFRTKRALAEILEKFLDQEFHKWTKTFPDEFYKEMFRLKDWQFNPKTPNKRPQIIGKYTNDIVYERLPPKLLNELQKRNPVLESGRRKQKHFQWFTPEHGHPKLKERLEAVIALMKISNNWRQFKDRMQRVYPKYGEQIPLAIDD